MTASLRLEWYNYGSIGGCIYTFYYFLLGCNYIVLHPSYLRKFHNYELDILNMIKKRKMCTQQLFWLEESLFPLVDAICI